MIYTTYSMERNIFLFPVLCCYFLLLINHSPASANGNVSTATPIVLIAEHNQQNHSSSLNKYSHFIRRLLPAQKINFHFNEKGDRNVTFRVFSSDVQHWNEVQNTFYNSASIHLQIMNESNFGNLTIILTNIITNQPLHLDDMQFLYSLLLQNNHTPLIFIQFGETNKRTEVNRIVQSVAKCTHQGKWNIPIPHLIYFCNDYDVSQILLQDTPTSTERAITQITLNTPENHAQYHQQRNQYSAAKSTSGFFVSALMRDDNDDNDDTEIALEQIDSTTQPDRSLVKRRKKRINKLKLDILKLRRKHAIMMAHQKYLPSLSSLPLRKRRILCKYRKSCYLSNQLPLDTLYRAAILGSASPREVCLAEQQRSHHHAEMHSEQINDLALKVFCKYRKSCYEQVLGAGYDESVKKMHKRRKTHRVLASKSAMIALNTKVRKKRTLKEIAEIALKHVDERQKRGAQRPKPKMAIVKKKLNELEEKRDKQLKCKYRKSCYETGIVSIVEQQPHYYGLISDLYDFMIEYIPLPSVLSKNETTTTENATTSDKDEEYKKKLFCKYRKSCYVTKVKPLIAAEEKFKYIHIMEKHEAEIPIQMKCHYRKSCYETGIVPVLRWSTPKEDDKSKIEMPWKEMPRSVAELKVRCHYRKSCYLRHAVEQTYLEHIAKSGESFEPEKMIQEKEQIKQEDLPMNHGPSEGGVVEPKVRQESKESEVKIEGSEEDTSKLKVVSKKRRQKARKELSPVEEEGPSEMSEKETEEAIPAAEKPHHKYHIIASENKTHIVHGHHKYRPIKHHLEKIALQRKHARIMAKRKHIVLTQLTVPQRKLLCKYRKSCYETGVIPVHVIHKVEREPCDESETKELSEVEIKVLCKYRKSCYDEIGTKYEQEASAKKYRMLLAGRGKLHVAKGRTRRSVKEIAEIALKRIDKRNEQIAQTPKPKMAIVEKKLSDADRDMHRRLQCMYRKSCYETGVKPKIEYGDNWLMRTYRFIARHVHTPSDESIRNVTFAQLDDDHKKLYCKYRKPCYETGIKPFIDDEERFTYRHVIHKEEVAIPLEIKCHYRKSCYETGIVPDLRTAPHYLSETEQPPIKKLLETIPQLKVHCKYRKSCYVNKTIEYPEIEQFLPTPPPPQKRVVIPASKLTSKKIPKAVKLEPEPTSTQPPKIVRETAEQEEVELAVEKQLEENITSGEEKLPEETPEKEIPVPKKRSKLQKVKTAAPKPGESLEKKTKIAADKKRKAAEAEASPEAPPKTIKKQKQIEKKEEIKQVDIATEKLKKIKPAKKETKEDDEKKPERREPKKEAPQKRVASDQKPPPVKEVKKEKPIAKKVKPIESVKTKEPVVKMANDTRQIEEIQKERKPEAMEEKQIVQKQIETGEVPKIVKVSEKVTKVRKPFDIHKRPQLQVPYTEIRYIPPPPDESLIEEKKPTIKEVHIEGTLDTLEEKLRCKYRKSCYHNRTLPDPFEGFKIHHIIKKEEQHEPIKYRCKFRKSCYESGQLPSIADTFNIKHLVLAKKEHKPLPLRCKYRKSCYKTGEVPKIDQQYYIVASMKNLLNEFYAETSEIRREMSEEERKLSCKYRKSCYATGKLPQIKAETIKTIADTMKETELSVHLRCKYRKSCYANYGIPVKDSKRVRKPAEAVIEQQPTPTSGKEQVRVKITSEERAKLQEVGTAEERGEADEEQERGKKPTKKGKKTTEKMKPSVDEKESKYMQIAVSVDKTLTNRTKSSLSAAKKLKCKYRLQCYDGVPLHKLLSRPLPKPEVEIKKFKRADGRPCTIYHLSCRRMAGLPIKQRAPIGPNGRRLCRKKPKVEKATPI